MKTVLKIILIVMTLALLIGVMGYLGGFFEKKIDPASPAAPKPADGGQTFVVQTISEPLQEQTAGTISAKAETVISAVVTATISSVSVRAGDEVQQGHVLIELDTRQMKARVGQSNQAVVVARARLNQIEKDFLRLQRIYKKDPGAVSRTQLERSQAELTAARAQVQQARRKVDEARTGFSYGTITAPISGRVMARYADPGDTARMGQPLLRLYDPTHLRLEAFVRESIASKLVKGQRLDISVDALEKRFQGVVDEIAPAADPGSRSFLVKVGLPSEPGLYPGMFGRLLIPTGEVDRRYIPNTAVVRVGQLDYVYVKSGQGRVRRFVRLGRADPVKGVEVISGLAPGETIFVP